MFICETCGKFEHEGEEHKGKLYCFDCFEENFVVCSECGMVLAVDDATYDKRGTDAWYCEDCHDELFRKCENCGDVYLKDTMRKFAGDWWCETCSDDELTECDSCGHTIHNDDAYCEDNECYCERCYNGRYATCTNCDESIHRNNVLWGNDNPYCNDCFYERFAYCDNCGETMEQDCMNYDEDSGQYYCDDCYEGHCTGIRSYNFKPHPMFRGKGPLFFGMELEVNHQVRNKDNVAWINEQQNNLLYCKEDGSLSGAGAFEIVSHPFSWEMYQSSIKQTYNEVLKFLVAKGYKSYDTTCCGIHIHMSLKAFSSWHLYKYMRFIYENADFVHRISQRATCPNNQELWQSCNYNGHCEVNCMVRWAKCDKENDRIIAESRTKTNQSERYTAVNLTNKTIEIRVFRGTLNANSFHKNLEFCHAVYYYTKNCSNQNVSVAEFVNWVQGKKEYKNLADFISAKFEERFLKCA